MPGQNPSGRFCKALISEYCEQFLLNNLPFQKYIITDKKNATTSKHTGGRVLEANLSNDLRLPINN